MASGIKLGLTDAGYALDVSVREAFDAAIIDIDLPGMDGLALTQRLRKDGPCHAGAHPHRTRRPE